MLLKSDLRIFENRWSTDWQKRYAVIMSKADLIKEVSTHYSRGCYQICNEWMVDHSARAIAVWNGRPRPPPFMHGEKAFR